MNKRILLVSNTSYSLIFFRIYLIKYLVKNGYEVHIIAPIDSYSASFIDLGCIYHPIKMDRKGLNPIADFFFFGRLFLLYFRLKPDLVFHYTIKPNIYGAFAAKLNNIISYSVVTGLGYTFINKSIVTLIVSSLYKISFYFNKEVWVLNEEDQNLFIERKIVHQDKVKVIPGEGIDINFYKPDTIPVNSSKTLSFAFIGRILTDKGICEYIEAANRVLENYSNVKFTIVGPIDIGNPKALPLIALNSLITNKISYLGHNDDIRSYLKTVDCVVLPSYREGLSRILLESAAMAVPIITADVPGCRELIDDGVTGLLCKVRDSTDLFLKMSKMVSFSVEKRKEMGDFGRLHVIHNFSNEIVLAKYKAALSDIFRRETN